MVATLLAAGALLAAAAPASAHAVLLSSTPADGAVLRNAPSKVELHFSEHVTITLGSLRVVDANGHRVDLGNVRHGSATSDVAVDLRSNLPNGTYVVGWHVISADSHPVHGGFLFSIKSKTHVANGVVASLSSTGSSGWQWAKRVLIGIGYAGGLLAVGIAVFAAWLADADRRDGRAPADDGEPQRATASRTAWWRWTIVGGVGAVVALVLGVAADAAQATGLGLGAVFHRGVLGQVLGNGTGWTIVGVAAAAVLALLGQRGPLARTRRSRRASAAGAVLILAGGFMASGHTRTTSPAALVFVADGVHVGAATVWFGGLVALWLAVRTIHRAPATATAEDPLDGRHAVTAARLVGRFSKLAAWSVLALAAAGVTLAWTEVRAIRALTSTTYGWLVVAKAAALVAILCVAVYNRYALTPAVAARPDAPAGWSFLRRTLAAELVGIIAVLGVTAVLTDTIPARTAAGIGTVAARTAPFGDGSVQIIVDPARRGTNAVHFYVLDRYGAPFDKLTNVRVDFRLPAAQLGPIEREPFHAGPGHWQLVDDAMAVNGTWEVTVLAQPDAFHEWSATVTVPIQP
ncbi:MAG TPA: copper resistance protein CopC [Acidimicrobiales bacterium]|nr:copper resistance protein CopC [Acidimicrobiales bacterium]